LSTAVLPPAGRVPYAGNATTEPPLHQPDCRLLRKGSSQDVV